MSRFSTTTLFFTILSLTVSTPVLPAKKSEHPSKNPAAVTSEITRSVPIFLLSILKHKLRYEKLEKIPTTPPASDCICVPYYLCDANNTIVTDGLGVIDVRQRHCTGDLEVCCKPPKVTSSTAPNITPTVTTLGPTEPETTSPTIATTMPTIPPTNMPPIVFPTKPPTPSMPPVINFPTGLPPNVNCICVPISQCSPNGVIITSGDGLIDPRQQLGLCPTTDLVCCRLEAIMVSPKPQTIPTSVPTTPTTRPTPTLPPNQQVCVICGSVLQCGIILIPGTGMIDPRIPIGQQLGNTCINNCCQAGQAQPLVTLPPESILSTTLGPLKFPGTPQACYCVKTWFCSEGNAVSPDGVGIIDPRFTACAAADQVCCKPGGIIQENRVLRDYSPAEITMIVNDDSGEPDPEEDYSVCGISNTALAPPQPYSLDSGKTYFGEFPWMVALFVKRPDSYLFICGASMINNRAVLTAAHCVASREYGTLVARFGEWKLENDTKDMTYQQVNVQFVVTHPQFYKAGLFHDVAVLILEKPVVYDSNVRPICLPEQGMSFAHGTRCYASGWGRTSFEGPFQDELHKVNLPIVDRSECQARLRTTRLGPYFQLHGSFMCAGGEMNRDTCDGDGGGPLVCKSTIGNYIQAGIISWGIGCGKSSTPAVYASVPQHRQWIDQQLASYGVL